MSTTPKQESEKLEQMKKLLKAKAEGYSGVLPGGGLVDRREFPSAIPLQKNEMMGIPEPKDVEFQHKARCPVCGTVFDTITTPTPELHGQGAAMLLQPERIKHRAASPKCMEDPRWIQGWVFDAPVCIGKRGP